MKKKTEKKSVFNESDKLKCGYANYITIKKIPESKPSPVTEYIKKYSYGISL